MAECRRGMQNRTRQLKPTRTADLALLNSYLARDDVSWSAEAELSIAAHPDCHSESRSGGT